MTGPQTMTPKTHGTHNANQPDAYLLRDRIVGAVWTLTHGTGQAPISLLRARFNDVESTEFDQVLEALSRENLIAVVRENDETFISMSGMPGVQGQVRDRIAGAIWSTGRGSFAPLAAIRARLVDVTPAEFDRSIASLVLNGELVVGNGYEQGWIRLAGPSYCVPNGGRFGY